MESILDTIKQLLGIPEDDDSFDTDVKVNINAAIFTLSQIGIGPSNGYIVESNTQMWNDYIGSSLINLEGVKNYIYLKTKSMANDIIWFSLDSGVKPGLDIVVTFVVFLATSMLLSISFSIVLSSYQFLKCLSNGFRQFTTSHYCYPLSKLLIL